MRLSTGHRGVRGRGVRAILATALAACVVAGCGGESPARDGLNPVPTRTSDASTTEQSPPPDPAEPIAVSDFTVLPTFRCLDETPARTVVTVGWAAPDAAEVSLSLDGQVLAVGLQDTVPYQVPAGGAAGIGAAVVFDCNAADSRTIDVAWAAPGYITTTRTVTVTKEPTDD
ncbi:hypothetical protein [Rhodococcoides kyotonense]|uniref:Lipoprotein n=1 Tax=Rhodococcoides kyotonense TaxID=398843 RepID=A0A239M0K8_9NOCA|nr:hypothetical protein [Rhodococcus kyotonensis]SNT35439.1 hypothetical protein SAMN05421642_11513 [Rhodococcus kyotonensis]